MIVKAKETMTSKQRVMNAFNHEKYDRIPLNFFSNPTVFQKLTDALGVPRGDYEATLNAIGVDFRGIGAPYKGKNLFSRIEGMNVDPVYGFYTRRVENKFGYYYDFCNYPLQFASDDKIYGFPVPSPDDFDYSNIAGVCGFYKDKALYMGSAGCADIINSAGRVFGMEETLVRLINEDEAFLNFIDRKLDMELGTLARIYDVAKSKIDFIWLGEDLGTQRTPMISLGLYRKVLKPRHKKFIDFANSVNLPVMVHTCGNSSWAYEDFIEMGVKAVDTLQPEAVNMSPEYLVTHFGNRLAFHGAISTAGTLTNGTPLEITETVKTTINSFRSTKSYMLSPAHSIQDNTPPENIIAMYNAAHKYGS